MPAADLEVVLTALGMEVDESRTDDAEVGAVDCPGHVKLKGHRNTRSKWSINRTTGKHNCYSCSYGGSLTSLVMDVRACSLWEALTWIRSFGIDFEKLADLKVERTPKEVRIVNESMLWGFEEPPLAELDKRFLTRAAARRSEVLWDTNTDSWVLPIRMPDGLLLGYQQKNKRLFLNKPDDMKKSLTLFGVNNFRPGMTAILVESPLDCPRIYAAGVEGAVSSFGVNVSEQQMKLIITLASKLVIALDNDSEGRKKTREMITGIRKKLGANGLREVQVTNWARRVPTTVWNYGSSEAKDPGEQTAEEIQWSWEHRQHAAAWDLL